jgi:hypothetical protein
MGLSEIQGGRAFCQKHSQVSAHVGLVHNAFNIIGLRRPRACCPRERGTLPPADQAPGFVQDLLFLGGK